MIENFEELVTEILQKADNEPAHFLLVFVASDPSGVLHIVLTSTFDARGPNATFEGLCSNANNLAPVGTTAHGWEAVFVAPVTGIDGAEELNNVLNDMVRRIASGNPAGPNGVPFACFRRSGEIVASSLPSNEPSPSIN